MPPLQRAFSFTEVNAVTMFIGKNLDFNMARIFDPLLHINFPIAEGSLGLARSSIEGRFQFLGRAHQAHALSPAPGRGLEHDGISHLGRNLDCLVPR